MKDLPESKLLHTEFMFWYSEKILVNIHYCCKLLNLFTEFFRCTCSCVMLLNLSGEIGIVNFTKTETFGVTTFCCKCFLLQNICSEVKLCFPRPLSLFLHLCGGRSRFLFVCTQYGRSSQPNLCPFHFFV